MALVVKNPTSNAGDIRDTGSIPGSGRYPGGKKVKSENEVARSCPTLCNPMDLSQAPLSTGILQAGILEWAAMASSRGSSWPRDWTRVSYVSCIGRWVLYHWSHLGSPWRSIVIYKPAHHLRSCFDCGMCDRSSQPGIEPACLMSYH